jgi:hypothetical protein
MSYDIILYKMKQNKRQQKINKMLKSINCSRQAFDTYGRIIKEKLSNLLIKIDFIVPSFRLITLFALILKILKIDVELRYTLHNKEN